MRCRTYKINCHVTSTSCVLRNTLNVSHLKCMLFQEPYQVPSTLRTTRQQTGESKLHTEEFKQHFTLSLHCVSACVDPLSPLPLSYTAACGDQGMAELRSVRLPKQRCGSGSADRASCADAD